MAKYERLLEKVAQNIYDGLSVLRNENVVRDQGLTSLNPEDNPIYYDGSSKVYDGTKGAGEYDHKYTIKARLAGSGIGTSVSSSAIPSSNSSSSSSSGGGSY